MTDYAAALELSEHALTLYRKLGAAEDFAAGILDVAARCSEQLGDRGRAAAYLAEAAGILTELEDPGAEAMRWRSRELSAGRSPDERQP